MSTYEFMSSKIFDGNFLELEYWPALVSKNT